MSYITTISLRCKPGTFPDIERVFREVLVAGRRDMVERGDLLSTSLVHVGGDADGDDFQVISHWTSKQAHDRNEDSPPELEAQRAATPFLITPRSFTEVRHQRVARFIRHLLIYGSLTGTLLLLYLGGIVILQTLVRQLIGQDSPLVIVVCTLGAVALLQPLRRRIQSAIDRRFYRDRYDARRTLEEFRLAMLHEVDLAQLSEQILTGAQKTVHPAFASLWLFPPHADNDGALLRGGEKAQTYGARIVSDVAST